MMNNAKKIANEIIAKKKDEELLFEKESDDKITFSRWFNENKNSDFLKEMYENYKEEFKQMGFRPDPYRKWAQGIYKAQYEMR